MHPATLLQEAALLPIALMAIPCIGIHWKILKSGSKERSTIMEFNLSGRTSAWLTLAFPGKNDMNLSAPNKGEVQQSCIIPSIQIGSTIFLPRDQDAPASSLSRSILAQEKSSAC